jgi:26S proteasome regulatory subunit N7
LAVKYLNQVLAKQAGAGKRIDLGFALIRVGLAFNDLKLVKANVAKCKGFVETGGDWERRNLLQVYEATYLMVNRQLVDAAALFLKSTATFTCTQLYEFNTFVFYAALTAMISLDRVALKKKVIKSPDVLSVIDEIPNLRTFVTALYECKYATFFQVLPSISDQIKRTKYFGPHAGFFLREVRLVAYAQFLQSYRSVTVSSMSKSFGVSEEFLDKELSRFISVGRLSCKIDKVNGVVNTSRSEARNTQYQETMRLGDLLMGRLQVKLSVCVCVFLCFVACSSHHISKSILSFK